jgi:hypothetical protein
MAIQEAVMVVLRHLQEDKCLHDQPWGDPRLGLLRGVYNYG